MNTMTTAEAARTAGTRPYHLMYLIHQRQIPPPKKNASGDYLWTRADLARVRRARRRMNRRVAV
jgi:DNA-binding transcriptional MerR regulator